MGSGLGMARRMSERALHRALGIFDGALTMTSKAVIDPGLGPTRLQPHGFRKSALGFGGFVARKQRPPVCIMCLRHLRRAMTGFARSAQCLLRLVQIKEGNRC